MKILQGFAGTASITASIGGATSAPPRNLSPAGTPLRAAAGAAREEIAARSRLAIHGPRITAHARLEVLACGARGPRQAAPAAFICILEESASESQEASHLVRKR
jgi:hypothetical protein